VAGGFNTNVRYRERVFHVQTEDSGPQHPHVITLLYEAGAILYSKKTSYADRKGGSIEAAVRELMEHQHRDMVKGLKSGVLDEAIGLKATSEKPRDTRRTPEVIEFGHGILTGRPLDEVVLAHVASL
jgi:hypothetical protein